MHKFLIHASDIFIIASHKLHRVYGCSPQLLVWYLLMLDLHSLTHGDIANPVGVRSVNAKNSLVVYFLQPLCVLMLAEPYFLFQAREHRKPQWLSLWRREGRGSRAPCGAQASSFRAALSIQNISNQTHLSALPNLCSSLFCSY